MHSLRLKIAIFTIAERNSYASCSRAIFGKSTDDRNDVIVAQFVVLFIVRANFRDTSTEMDVKTVNVVIKKRADNNFPWFVLLSTIEMTTKYSKLCIDFNIMTSFLRPVRVQTVENGCWLSQIKRGLNYIAARLFIVESFSWELRIRKMEKSVNNTHGYASVMTQNVKY